MDRPWMGGEKFVLPRQIRGVGKFSWESLDSLVAEVWLWYCSIQRHAWLRITSPRHFLYISNSKKSL